MARLSKGWRPKTEVIRFSPEQAVEIYREFRKEFCKDQPLPKVEEIPQDGFDRLSGCIGSIGYQTKEGKYLYKPGVEAAAAYFFFINKSHWLLNGNKRSAMMFTLGYLKAHNKWLRIDWTDLYKLAKRTAVYQGRARTMLGKIKGAFQQALIDYSVLKKVEFVASWEAWRKTH